MARVPLRDDRTLWHEEGACLPLRSRHGQCRACAAACPVQALSVDVDAVALSAACVGCGRCTAACPTGALGLPEIDALPGPAARAEPVRIECRMVPQTQRQPGSVVLPCLGALTTGQVLAHNAAGQAVRVIDRGWCDGCVAGGTGEGVGARQGVAAAREMLATASAWLGALSASPPQQARPDSPPISAGEVKPEPLPQALRPASLPETAAAAPAVSRRSFFRTVVEQPAGRAREAAVPMGGDGRAAYPATDRRPAPERERQLAALDRLAARSSAPVPAEFFPMLAADAGCCDHRLCVALCPTAALTADDSGATTRLRFDPVRCIACGTCERGCPEGALQLQAHGGSRDVQTLATHRRLRCSDCGDTFTAVAAAPHRPAGAGGDPDTGPDAESPPAPTVCPTCIKARRFMADARRQLFGALS